jgi:hypothetical protein
MLKELSRAYNRIAVAPQPSGFGAEITGVDLTRPCPPKPWPR